MRVTAPLLAVVAACAIALAAASSNFYPEQQSIQKPIIAQLYADPTSFSGRTVEVYGLVVESNAKNEFLLQDVSQRSLRVVGSAAIGDQVTVVGRFHASAQSIYLTAERLIPTKVTGGGGCC
jgi:hypothetical protein